jgi:PAS domain S-box-containing protein
MNQHLVMSFKHNFGFELFENLPELYFLLNSKGEIIEMNKTAIKLHETDTGKKPILFLDMVELCDREKAYQTFTDCLSNKTTQHFDTRLQVNKKLINCKLTYSIPPSVNGIDNSSNVFVIARDTTEEKNKEVELLRFANIVENSINPILITDLNGKMIYVNPAFIRASGYNKEELIGSNPRIFGSGKLSPKFWDKMWQTISSGKVWFGEVEDKKKNGEPFYTQLLVSPIIDNEGRVTGYFGIHRDISEKRTLEKQLIHTQKMESIGTLAAGVAHEVGNPLASISALVQVAQRNTEDKFISEKLGLVKNQITRISKIIRDLVDFSRPSDFELQTTNINDTIKESVEITKVGTKAKDIEFDVKLSDDIPNLPLVADQVEQVFVNILLNAVDAINETKTELKEKRISVESSMEDSELVLTFTDTGPGIKEEHLNKIFEPFFTTKEQGKGTGLGLWVSYGIIKSFQGNIEVQSKLNQGTIFTITLPFEA